MKDLNWRILLSCFLRTYFVGASFNTRGMQNVGLAFVMEPGLERIYPDPRELRLARKRYMAHYNTHLFWTPLMAGVFLSVEDKIARDIFRVELLDNVRNTMVYTLSAIGDSLFASSLLVFWSLIAALLAVAGGWPFVAVWCGLWFMLLHLFKAACFTFGFREGLGVLNRLRNYRLIDWSTRLKYVNAVILAVLLFVTWNGGTHTWSWVAAVAVLVASAAAVLRLHLSRTFLLLLAMGAAGMICWIIGWSV